VAGIKELAKELNLAVSTVSRALNGSAEASEETKALVQEAAARLGYLPNQSGRSLRRGTTGSVGFMIQSGPGSVGHGDSFFMRVFDGVQSVLARHDLDLVALFCAEDQDPYEYLRRMVGRGVVDAVVISSTNRIDPRIDLLASRRIPFVTMGRSLTDAGQPWIDSDIESYAKRAIDRLVQRGHSRIAITVPPDEINIGHLFRQGVTNALEAHGLDANPAYIIPTAPSEAGGEAAVRTLLSLETPPTAAVLSHESITTGFYHGLEKFGRKAGRDFAVVGFANSYSSFLSPPLTAFRQSPKQIGIDLAEALLATMPRFAEEYPLGVVRKLWVHELVEGASDAMTIG
jgi:DNA-binding LacI/PurR family transcriptional regulator